MKKCGHYKKVKTLKNMDKVIRMINDEENGIFDEWIEIAIPDEVSDSDFYELAKDDRFYTECCCLFAKRISDLIANGSWNSNGYTVEFFNVEKFNENK